MAHKKGASSSKNGRDSNSQRLGVKRFGGQEVGCQQSLGDHQTGSGDRDVGTLGHLDRLADLEPLRTIVHDGRFGTTGANEDRAFMLCRGFDECHGGRFIGRAQHHEAR